MYMGDYEIVIVDNASGTLDSRWNEKNTYY